MFEGRTAAVSPLSGRRGFGFVGPEGEGGGDEVGIRTILGKGQGRGRTVVQELEKTKEKSMYSPTRHADQHVVLRPPIHSPKFSHTALRDL